MVQGSKTLQYLRKSQLLALPGVAEHFLETATSLLMFAVTCQGSSPPSAGDSAALLGNAVTERAFLCDFLYISHAEGRRSFTCLYVMILT